MKLLKLLLRESKIRILFVGVFGIISGSGMTLLMKVIHEALTPGEHDLRSLMAQLAFATLLFVGGSLCGNLPLIKLTAGIVFKLRLRTIRRILASDLRHLESQGKHRLFTSLTTDINRLSSGLTTIPGLMINLAMLAGSVGYVLFLAWKVMLVFIPFIFLLSFLFKISNKLANKRFEALRETSDILMGFFKTITDGTKELKLHQKRRAAFMNEKVIPVSETHRRNRIAGYAAFQIAGAVMGLGFFFITGVLIFGFPAWGLVDQQTLAGLVMVFIFIYTPLSKMFELLSPISQANVSLRKMETMQLSLLDSAETAEEIQPGHADWKEIQLHGVTYTYFNERVDEQFSMGPIDMKVKPGEILFITGGNGSGKSTLAKLITSLYTPEDGYLTMDGKKITEKEREDFRNYFSTVFSDFYLFDDFMGIEDPELLKNANRYLEALHLEHKVKVVGNQLSTINLSTGQRKRLSLLLAYLEDRPIYLFDEWASDQDPQFKKIFYMELLPELRRRNKAVVVITHDDRYFDQADRTIKLADGQIVERYNP